MSSSPYVPYTTRPDFDNVHYQYEDGRGGGFIGGGSRFGGEMGASNYSNAAHQQRGGTGPYDPPSNTFSLPNRNRYSKDYASNTMADIYRAEWQDYLARFAPLEDEFMRLIQDEEYAQNLVDGAGKEMQEGVHLAIGKRQRDKERLGLVPVKNAPKHTIGDPRKPPTPNKPPPQKPNPGKPVPGDSPTGRPTRPPSSGETPDFDPRPRPQPKPPQHDFPIKERMQMQKADIRSPLPPGMGDPMPPERVMRKPGVIGRNGGGLAAPPDLPGYEYQYDNPERLLSTLPVGNSEHVNGGRNMSNRTSVDYGDMSRDDAMALMANMAKSKNDTRQYIEDRKMQAIATGITSNNDSRVIGQGG